MRIAIQGNFKRHKEVIDILINLGGINKNNYVGDDVFLCYYIDDCNHIEAQLVSKIDKNFYKCYTLEEFEKEFPFKIGDKVVFKIVYGETPHIHTITGFEFYGTKFCYLLDNVDYMHFTAENLKLYQPMKEERNIALTLDKAKEWYQKGGELKEIALQVFTEKELNPLPISWKEFCKTHAVTPLKYIFVSSCPRKYIALWKLEKLRDCYRQGWTPDWTSDIPIDSIFIVNKEIGVTKLYSKHFLSFQSEKVAKEFIKNFESLIKEAEEFI